MLDQFLSLSGKELLIYIQNFGVFFTPWKIIKNIDEEEHWIDHCPM